MQSIEKSGPLRHLTCLKYEAKHQLFKKFGSICCNFKNIIVSATNISQMTQCCMWGTNRPGIRRRLEENASAELITKIDQKMKEALIMKGLPVNENMKILSKIGYYGTQYAIKSFVVFECDPNNFDMPIFGKILKIVLCNKDIHLR